MSRLAKPTRSASAAVAVKGLLDRLSVHISVNTLAFIKCISAIRHKSIQAERPQGKIQYLHTELCFVSKCVQQNAPTSSVQPFQHALYACYRAQRVAAAMFTHTSSSLCPLIVLQA